jgi:abortive infection bacteriophage resistance protein
MDKVLYSKPALSYADQINQLKQRGLIIENEPKAIHLLEVISYYRLSGYWYPMLADKENHVFKPYSTFETAFNIYKFDRELRLLVLQELEKIEVAVRAKMIYILSHNRSPFWYLDPNNFRDNEKHAKTLSDLEKEFDRSDEEFIQSFRSKYSNPMPPSWMVFEVSSFGVLSRLYSNLSIEKDKRDIANFFGLSDVVFTSWLHSIVYLRNICAHHSRLWNREMSVRPKIPRNPRKIFIVFPQTETSINNKTFFILSMIIYLMNTINPKHNIQSKIKNLLNEYPNIDTKAMGFPDNWQDEELWK